MRKARVEKDLTDYFIEAIHDNYLIVMLITSYTQAKNKTRNLPFGLGKTTLAFWLNYYLNGSNWNKVFETSVYNPYDLAKLLEPGSERKLAVVWDDTQATAPATQGVPRAIRRLANFISTERPEIACIIMTAPNISSISAPLRNLVNFEIIVSERGYYEVHKISYHKNFKRPHQDLARFEYIEELAREAPFPPLPDDIQKRYRQWRINQKLVLYPSLLGELETYTKLQEWNKDAGEIPILHTQITKGSHGYIVNIPEAVGKNLHKVPIEVMLTKR